MGKIHILSTSLPSRLWRDLDSNELKFDNLSSPNSNECTKCLNQHIYITNDEEIREGDWVFDSTNYGLIHKVWGITEKHFSFKDSLHARGLKSTNRNLKCHFKKIILTTNQDLITDGVQAIDDEFLEWLVKNPTCEEVEVERIIDLQSWNESTGKCNFVYIVNIPKEEPKQETLEDFIKSIYPSPNGAKIRGIELGAKWQAERMYSEEEVVELLTARCKHFGTSLSPFDKLLLKQDLEWFEQSKKK